MTNLYYIAVLSIFLSPSLSLPSSQSYKIVIWFIWKTFHIWAVDSDHITRRTCEAHKWKFNVFVTMGQVFLFAFVAVCNFFLFCADYERTNSTKTLFPCFDTAHRFYKKKFRHVWRLHVSYVQAERCFNNGAIDRNAHIFHLHRQFCRMRRQIDDGLKNDCS